MDLQTFITRWSSKEFDERKNAHEHFIDLCHLLNQPTPMEADPAGTAFCFEYGGKKESGGQGWADVFLKGKFGWEYKGEGKDLDAAYEQLKDYRSSLENPPLLIVCDGKRFRIHLHFQNTPVDVHEFRLDQLLEPSAKKPELTNLELLHFAFTDPELLRIGKSPRQVTEQAAINVSEIAERMPRRGIPPFDSAHFIMKLVFCMFAEWTGLLPRHFLRDALNDTRNRMEPGTSFEYLEELFGKMHTGGRIFTDRIPHFNGGLFDGAPPLLLENSEVRVLLEAARLDWRKIEPSIFGTLLEGALSAHPERRQQLGAHYTRSEDVEKVIQPVILDPLRAEWFALRDELDKLAAPRQKKQRQERLEDFLERLANLRIFDPACGSGNFLYIALKAVMDIEDEVRRYAAKAGMRLLSERRVTPQILMGYEIDPYAKELASTVIWIGFIQHRLAHSLKYEEQPILQPLENIVLADSLLAPDGSRAEWPECDFIVGNPPFLGSKRHRASLNTAEDPGYVDRLYSAYTGALGRESDLSAYFFEQTRRQILEGKARRAGLLATNSIRDVASRGVLARINQDTPIFAAWADQPWGRTLVRENPEAGKPRRAARAKGETRPPKAAAVRISIVCFGAPDAIPAKRTLDGEAVERINSDLTSGIDLTAARRLAENAGLAFMGDKKNGPFELSTEQAEQMLAATDNPNKRPNSDVVRPWLHGRNFLSPGQGKGWIIDFGTDMSEAEAAKYVLPFEYVRKHVKPVREQRDSRYSQLRDAWWIHGSPAHEMRTVLAKLDRAVATVIHTHTRIFRFFQTSSLPYNALIAFAFNDFFSLGVLESSVHRAWTLGMGSELEDRPRYTPTTTFETFPFPRISPHLRERYPLVETGPSESEAAALIAAVETAARELYEARDNVVLAPGTSCPSYTQLYKDNPAWLQLAHAKLDRAVLACYGLPQTASREEILALLLAENLSRPPR